jgi:hypothetical protein
MRLARTDDANPVDEIRGQVEASPSFAEVVAEKTDPPVANPQRSVAASGSGEGFISQAIEKTPSVPSPNPGAVKPGASKTEESAEKGLIHTPFGTFDAVSINARLAKAVEGSSPMEIYFMVQAPGTWVKDPRARAEFAKLYGPEALITLDLHGTVPKNEDPVWVTKPYVNTATGRA